jgi:hypothetical protein
MAEVIHFQSRDDRQLDIDLLTAVDVAIRDLRDITQLWGEEAARIQLEECRRMLEAALRFACRFHAP